MRRAIDKAFEKRLASLVNAREPGVLQDGLKGVERESLRVLADMIGIERSNRLAGIPEPKAVR